MEHDDQFNIDATNFDDEYDKAYYHHQSHVETNQLIFLDTKGTSQPLYDFQLYNTGICKPPQTNENMSVLSHSSGYSTNCSAKQSPEYQYEFQSAISRNHIDENEEESDDSDIASRDKSRKSGRFPERTKKKGIYKKNYEPLIDNAIVYKYEDNPEEYKKARKRLQNRESATRVRSKKKTHFENLEQEIVELKEKNAELMIQNASLAAENNQLKNQISFFEKFLMPGKMNLEDQTQKPTQPILPVQNFPKTPEPNTDWVRVSNNPIAAKKHITILSVVTFLLYIVSFNPSTEDDGQDAISFANQFRNKFDRGLKFSNQTISQNGAGNSEETEMMDKMMEYLMSQHYKFSAIKDVIWKILFLGYLLYLFYLAYNFFIKSWVRKGIKLKII